MDLHFSFLHEWALIIVYIYLDFSFNNVSFTMDIFLCHHLQIYLILTAG